MEGTSPMTKSVHDDRISSDLERALKLVFSKLVEPPTEGEDLDLSTSISAAEADLGRAKDSKVDRCRRVDCTGALHKMFDLDQLCIPEWMEMQKDAMTPIARQIQATGITAREAMTTNGPENDMEEIFRMLDAEGAAVSRQAKALLTFVNVAADREEIQEVIMREDAEAASEEVDDASPVDGTNEEIKKLLQGTSDHRWELSACTIEDARIEAAQKRIARIGNVIDKTTVIILKTMESCCSIDLDGLNHLHNENYGQLCSSISEIATTHCANLNHAASTIQDLLSPVKIDMAASVIQPRVLKMPKSTDRDPLVLAQKIRFTAADELGIFSALQMRNCELPTDDSHLWIRAPRPRAITFYLPLEGEGEDHKPAIAMEAFSTYRVIDSDKTLAKTSREQRKRAVKDSRETWGALAQELAPMETTLEGQRRAWPLLF